MFGAGLSLRRSIFFSRNQLYVLWATYLHVTFLAAAINHSLPLLVKLSTEKIKDTGWDAVWDLITLIPLVFIPIPPQRSHQILAWCFKATAELSVKWLVPADVLSLTCAFSFFLLTLSIWIADCNTSVFLIQKGRVYIKLAQLSFQQA